ncbi:MAG: NUDIX hydrolase [Woeseiaceae bacterium]
MPQKHPEAVINLLGVIVAVTDEVPRILVADHGDRCALPNGPFDPSDHASLEDGLRHLVEAQTGLDLFYVEQLYTFGNRNRDPAEIVGGPRVVSVAYIALAREDQLRGENVRWADWYQFLPWEDWRNGRPDVISESIEPALQRWVQKASSTQRRKNRQERRNVTFGDRNSAEMDAVLTLERFELLYEVGLVSEAQRDALAIAGGSDESANEDLPGEMGMAMAFDHRRVLATALGRLRGKLAYRPVVFELLPGEFTLLQLQRVAEALSGAKLHKQNFRRLVIHADLVEPVGRTTAVGRGRPAELFRFRREVLGEKLTVGLSRPVMRTEGA